DNLLSLGGSSPHPSTPGCDGRRPAATTRPAEASFDAGRVGARRAEANPIPGPLHGGRRGTVLHAAIRRAAPVSGIALSAPRPRADHHGVSGRDAPLAAVAAGTTGRAARFPGAI